jgi:hypothetical protein
MQRIFLLDSVIPIGTDNSIFDPDLNCYQQTEQNDTTFG